jgi:hypothetical protein
VFRAALLVLILCLSFEVSGLAAICGDPGGNDDCSGAIPGGECPPNCHACDCCSLPRIVAPAVTTEIPQPPVAATPSWRGYNAPPAVDPADIFHVPKSLLA